MVIGYTSSNEYQMRQMAHLENALGAEHSAADIDPTAVLKAMEEILHSAPFRTSKQCQDMLRYVVEHSLRQEQESLRERVIGANVFGRSPDYDTSDDPVVRVRAADIRKRLAQYYQSAAPGVTSIHIEIPSGSYRANFDVIPHESIGPAAAHEIEPAAVVPAPAHPQPVATILPLAAPEREMPAPNYRRRTLWTVAAMLVAVLLGWFSLREFYATPQSALDQFWAPVVNNPKPVLIYAGANAVYRLSADFLDRYRKAHHLENEGPEFFPELAPGEKIDARDLIPVTNTSADAQACADLVSLLTRVHRSFELRYGSDIAVGDLHDSPTILIGAFNNTWTLNMTRPMRFTFKEGTRVEDTWGKTKGWAETRRPNGDMLDDYAVISRMLDLQTGRVLITVAGIGSYGTEKAAEFLTNPQEMAELVKSAPAGWQKKSMQVVLHVRIENTALETVNVVATQYW
jgi:hypothetical protein